MKATLALLGLIPSLILPVHAQTTNAYEQGRSAFLAHHYGDAVSLFAEAERQDPGHSDALLFEGKSLANLKRFHESDLVLHQYLDRHPDSVEALYMLGYVLHRENEPRDSLQLYTKAARLSMPKSDDLKVVALDYVLLNDYPEAIRWLEKAVQFDPHNQEAWYGLGRCYYTQSRFPEAENAFRKALDLDPRDTKAEANLALVYDMQNRAEDADRTYKHSVDLAEADPHADEWPYLNYSSFLLEHDRASEAVPLLRRAIAIAPKCADCHGKLGRALSSMGKPEQAIAELQQAVALAPQDPKLHYDLGRVYRTAGLIDKAKAELALSAKLYGTKDSVGSK